MAATPQPQPATGGFLTKVFNAVKWVGHHLFSPTMIFMMVAMALPGVAAAATAVSAKATLGDIGLAVFDHYKTMFSAPFTEFGTLKDAFVNSFSDGNWAAGSYELGAHGAHGAAGAAHGAAGAAAGASHTAAASCTPFDVWSDTASTEELASAQKSMRIAGAESLHHWYESTHCRSHG